MEKAALRTLPLHALPLRAMSLPDIQDALALVEQGRTSKAIPLLERLVEAVPPYAAAHALLAEAYEGERRWRDALAAWQRAYFLAPNSPAVALGLRRTIAAQSAPLARTSVAAREPEAAPPFSQKEPAAVEAPKRTRRHAPPEKARPSEKPAAKKPEGQGEVQRTSERPLKPGAPEKTAGRTSEEANDLDRLIEELEAVRIVPRPDLEALPTPDLDDEIEDMVSETLARIYASQKQYDEAARVYELLAAQHPERSEGFLEKAAQMRARASVE